MADTQNQAGMLAGCRVLDFTQYLAGPTVTRLMAEMGADIVKVDFAPMGDPSRLLPMVKHGRSGYFVQKTGYDMIAQSFSGLMHMTGEPNGPPTFVGIGIADVGSGVYTFAALGYALYHRERTGIGHYIHIAMVDTLYHMHDFGLQSHSLSDGEFVPTRMGRYHSQICPAGVYKGPQGWIFILVLDRQWSNMVKAMSRSELLDDPRFATGAQRTKNADQLNAIVQQWML